MAMPKAYGLTGGICSGKSTVADMFRKMGAVVINADDISREICQKGESGWLKIKQAFGCQVFNADQTLNRKKLSEIVFSDPQKRKILEKIEHPLIMQQIRKRIREYFDSAEPLVLIEATLILEAGHEKDFHGLIVVNCKVGQQLERLQKRQNLSKEKALQMINAQMPLEEKVKKATFVIDNSGSLEETLKNTQDVFDKIKAKKERKLPRWH